MAADPSQVIAQLFGPGQEGFESADSRVGPVENLSWTIRPRFWAGWGSPCCPPAADEQDRYVPNVVDPCGALTLAGALARYRSIDDEAIGIATMPASELLSALEER